nr:hypothetical protein [Vulcanimicrobium alpinum]
MRVFIGERGGGVVVPLAVVGAFAGQRRRDRMAPLPVVPVGGEQRVERGFGGR